MDIFSHRGLGPGVENTLPAFTSALNLGVDGIEIDVRLCASGEVVCFHDPTLYRLAKAFLPIKSATLDELKHIKLSDKGTIATLDEALELIGLNAEIILDLKTIALRDGELERKVIEAIKRHKLEDSVTLSSDNPMSIIRCYNLGKEIKRALIVSRNNRLARQFRHLLLMDAIHPEAAMVTKSKVRRWKKRGWKVRAWTPNLVYHIEDLKNMGVDAVITDRPQAILNHLED